MTTIQVRVDEQTKSSAKKILEEIGLDMSSAIKMFLKQISVKKGIPFTPALTENGMTKEEEDEIIKATKEAEAGINVTPAMDAKDAIEYLRKL